jgi:hypothetical protein
MHIGNSFKNVRVLANTFLLTHTLRVLPSTHLKVHVVQVDGV